MQPPDDLLPDADLIERIVNQVARRHSTAVVLMHHAVAERLGLGPTDHKCLDVLQEHGPMGGSQLGAVTGLTSGAVSGVVARLERGGYVRREPDPHDGRKQILHPVPERVRDLADLFTPLRRDMAELLEALDSHQLAAVAGFLDQAAERSLRHAAALRASTRSGAPSALDPVAMEDSR